MPSSDEMKNPCLRCDHHLSGGDKNADCCMDCADRVRYVAAIGGMFGPVPIEMTDMGRRRPAINKEENMNHDVSTTSVTVDAGAPETTRTCNKCGETKPLDEFRKNHTCLHGREPVCKACKNIEARRKTAEARAKRLAANPPKPVPQKDLETTKACRVCGETKPLVQFVINKTCKDGHENVCKNCLRISNAEKRAEKRKAAAETTASPAGTGIPLVITAPDDPSPGNLLEDYMETKICLSCGKTKALALFPNDNASDDGREAVCKECHSNYQTAKAEAKSNLVNIAIVGVPDLPPKSVMEDAVKRSLGLTPAYLRMCPEVVVSENYPPELPKYVLKAIDEIDGGEPGESDELAATTTEALRQSHRHFAPVETPQVSGLSPHPSPLSTQIGGDHYKHFAIQPIEFTTRNRLGFIEGCVVKRICRYNRPGGKGLQDLLKIKHEIDCLIAIDEKEKAERSQGRQA